jgi:hypothetical protein
MQFAAIPAWALNNNAPNALNLYEAIALAGHEDQWIRLDADTQRKLIGFPVFGKQEIKLTTDGELAIRRSTCFGADSEIGFYVLSNIRRAAAERKRISPGCFGPGVI